MENKGIVYYTDNKISGSIFENAKKYIKASELPIVSCSLKPMDFGKNIVLKNESRSYPTMVRQIIMALENLDTKYVFFCEHDVLYHKSHFDFTPPKDDIYYYNSNVWRWKLLDNIAITHFRMLPLSSLCVNREFVLKHYKFRLEKIIEFGWEKYRSREPRWVRRIGYEPGTKKKKRGGLTDDNFETWTSEYPNIDIRHRHSFSRPKVSLDEFKHKPKDWQEIPVEEIPHWDLKKIFNL